jgi:hypothetical protein
MTDTAPTPDPRDLIKRLREAAARKWPGAEPAERHSLFSQAADAIEAMTAPTPDRAAMMQALEALCLDAGGEEQIRIEADAIAALRAALAHHAPAEPQSKRERDACAPGAEFEHWWPKYMPRALQDDAWAEWCAIRSNSAPPAEPADPLAWVTSSAAPPQPPSAPAEPAEPVAWQERVQVGREAFSDWYERSKGWALTRPQEIESGGVRYQFRPLYAAPQPVQPPATAQPVQAPQPLTADEVERGRHLSGTLSSEGVAFAQGVRFAERAHGIGAAPDAPAPAPAQAQGGREP